MQSPQQQQQDKEFTANHNRLTLSFKSDNIVVNELKTIVHSSVISRHCWVGGWSLAVGFIQYGEEKGHVGNLSGRSLQ